MPSCSRAARLLAALAAVLACAAPAQAGSFYRWVDEHGVVHYSDVAPPAPIKVEQRKLTASVVDTSEPDYATQVAAKNSPISLYTAPSCKDACNDARDLLQRRGVPFREISVNSPDLRAELKKVSGAEEVPVLKVGKDIQRGYEAGAFNTSLDAAGYPASVSRKPAPAKAKPVKATPESEGEGAGAAGAGSAGAGGAGEDAAERSDKAAAPAPESTAPEQRASAR